MAPPTEQWIELPATGSGSSGVSSLNGLTGAVSLVPGSGITITPSGSSITIASTGGGGGVSSVGLSLPVSIFTVSGSPVTSSGTLTGTLISQSANTFFASPNGSAGIPSFRAIVAADIPTLNQNTTGTASNITATSNSTLTTLSALSLPGSQVSGNISGNAGNITGTTNSTLTTLSSLSLPYTQITGAPTVSGFTQGSVLFANSSGNISQDNSNFYWNDTTFNLGLGVIPATNITIDTVNTTGTSKAIQTTSYGVGSAIPFRGRFARGTPSSPTAANSGDTLSTLSGRGYGSSQFATASTGAINVVAGETFTNTSNATYLQFEVTNTGSVTLSEAARISPAGNLLVGTTTDSGTQKLQILGNSNVGTVTSGIWNGTATSGNTVLTSGTTYTTPAGITTNTVFKFTLVGGGAGGSSSNSASTHSTGGGAGGGLILFTSGLSPSTGYTISIGSAGAGGASTDVGAAGGSTTLVIGANTYTAGGGNPAATTTTTGGPGGTATNGTINITGGAGGPAMAIFTSGGMPGGNSPFGLGFGGIGNPPSAAANGNPGTGFGAGGGGSSSNGGPTGGAGTQGIILVEWKN